MKNSSAVVNIARYAIALLAALAGSPAANADQHPLPLWELGAVVGVGILPDYPAAGQSRFEVLPLPYFTYRGKVIRSDDKGLLRGRLFHSNRAELDVSLAGAFNVNSTDNVARTGMPDLDWLGEIGPRFEITLARAGDAKIDLELPVRAVLSTNFTSRAGYEGLITVPELAYQHDNFLGSSARFKLGFGAAFANAKLQSLLYGVPAAYATAARPAYTAKGGYMGSKVQVSASRRFGPNVRVISALRFDFHRGAANDLSPLFKDRSTTTLGVAIIWSLWRSPVLVPE